jgi:hypothetical protein
MIPSTLPGTVALGCSGVRVVSSFSCAIFADFAMRGRAISITKLAGIAFASCFPRFLYTMDVLWLADRNCAVQFSTVWVS